MVVACEGPAPRPAGGVPPDMGPGARHRAGNPRPGEGTAAPGADWFPVESKKSPRRNFSAILDDFEPAVVEPRC